MGGRRGQLGQGKRGKLKKSFNSFYSEIPLKENVSYPPVLGVLFLGACFFVYFSFFSCPLQLYLHGLEFNVEECIYTWGRLSCVNHYSFYGNQWSCADLHDKRITPLYLVFELK